MVTHSKELALDRHEFEHYVAGARRIDNSSRRCEALFIAFVAGRLGLRAGEILHFQSDWIDWRRRRIDIPFHEPCDKGRGPGPCGYCQQQIKQEAEYSKLSIEQARLKVLQEQMADVPNVPGQLRRQIEMSHVVHIDSDLSKDALDRQLDSLLDSTTAVDDAEAFRDALDTAARKYRNKAEKTVEDLEKEAWTGKTENAARSVPFDWSPRSEIAVERFCDRFDEWPKSMSALRRRVDKSLELANDDLEFKDTTPHGLRSTAASYLAGQGLPSPALQAMFGWASIQTAQVYISSSPNNTQSQLQQLG